MHRYDAGMDELAEAVFAFALRRARADAGPGGVPLGHPQSPEALDAAAGRTITPEGIGAAEALRVFADVLEPACLSSDSPRYLAFVPTAPSEVSILADLVVSACSIYAGSWLEGAGAVWAENQALRWLADLAGLPPSTGGCFVSGGTNGNLSALVTARNAATVALAEAGRSRPPRWAVVVSDGTHSSVHSAADVMDADLLVIPGDRLTGDGLAPVLAAEGQRVAAVVATAGTTNLGLVDDLDGVAAACEEADVWLHVDAAYGGAALAAPSVRSRFAGVERADSLIVDPHKWLFAPFDVCALLYRNPVLARAAHVQHAAYLDVLYGDAWNPSDYAVHLTRRARGLPFWFSLAAHGTDAYAEAVEAGLRVTREAADLVRDAPHLELVVEPELSVLAFRRSGWEAEDYVAWSDRMLQSGLAFVVPSSHAGRPMLRLCVVNPRTTLDDMRMIFDSLR
ncbi:MAG: pyridoxal phosphate-dependent decarboxylase family protein [Acidimicrobiia bacterium]